MNAVTQLTELTLEETLARYDIGELVRFWPAANGIENSNYFLATQQGDRPREFVLTIMEQAANAGDSYAPMMEALYKGGLPIAPPLRSKAGRAIEETSGKPAMLQRRLRGQHVYNPTTSQVCALARFAARMHLCSQNADVQLPTYPRDEQWLTDRAALTEGKLPFNDAELLRASITKIRSLLARRDVQALPRGMIHGDLFRDNVLFNEHGLTGALDFHHAASGYWIFDLAVIANDWCNDATGLLDPERTTAMLRAYHQIRPLTQGELWFFSTFALYAALTFWLSRLTVTMDKGVDQPVRHKNPDEFKRIIEQHTRHSFYLDPRVLDL